jgi:hypothetical protein
MYFFTSSKPLSTIKTKLATTSHPTTAMVVSFIVNHEEHLLRVQDGSCRLNHGIKNLHPFGESIKVIASQECVLSGVFLAKEPTRFIKVMTQRLIFRLICSLNIKGSLH